MLNGRHQLLSLPGSPGSLSLEWVHVGRGVCEAPLQAREVGWRRLLTPTYLLTFPPVRGFRHKGRHCGRTARGCSREQDAAITPSEPSQECVWEAAHKTQVGSRRAGPSCEASEGSEGRADIRPEPLGSARPRSAEVAPPAAVARSQHAAVPFLPWWCQEPRAHVSRQ